jgi:hypothetical protein
MPYAGEIALFHSQAVCRLQKACGQPSEFQAFILATPQRNDVS